MYPRTTDEALRRLLDEGRRRAAAVGPEQARLWEALADATTGGKRFRPRLVTTIHDALGGSQGAAAAQVGAAVELLHTAFVIHDDVIDGDQVRRGRPTVSGSHRAEALAAGATPDGAVGLGDAAGILAGDLALTTAIRAVATCGAPPEVTHRLLDLFDAALHTTAAGELADVRLALNVERASLSQSLAMAERKTGAYSFCLPLQAGAVLAGAGRELVDRLAEVGRSLGVAFQLVDDLIGVFGDPEVSGKSATSDLRTAKQTPLLVHARSTPEWEDLAPLVGRDLTDEELAEARRLLTASGSREFVEEVAEAHLAAARVTVVELGLPDELVALVSTHPAALLGRAAA